MHNQIPYLFFDTNVKSFENFFYYLNRIVDPIINLNSLDQVQQFIDNKNIQ